VHLGGISAEAPWEEILDVNVDAVGEALGYHPLDDAETFAGEVGGDPEPLVGGAFTRFTLGELP